jgi:hypothetical protein
VSCQVLNAIHLYDNHQVYDGIEYSLEIQVIDARELHAYQVVAFKDLAENIDVRSYKLLRSRPLPFRSNHGTFPQQQQQQQQPQKQQPQKQQPRKSATPKRKKPRSVSEL